MRRPYNGTYPITRAFGVYDAAYANYPGSRHPGCDYGLPANTPLIAAISGTVQVIDRGTAKIGRGREVVITNGNTQVKYCHMNSFSVANGSKVVEGQQVGLSGYTGYVMDAQGNIGTPEGAHLHFETLVDGLYRDPEGQYNNQGGEMLTLDRARKLAYHFLGRNGFDGRQNALNGSSDADLNKNHVGKKTDPQAIDEFFASTEGKTWRDTTLPLVYKNRDIYKKRAEVAEKSLAEVNKALTIKDNEIATLKAQVGDNTKWETLKALVRELVGR